jgi:hypothetical protein
VQFEVTLGLYLAAALAGLVRAKIGKPLRCRCCLLL